MGAVGSTIGTVANPFDLVGKGTNWISGNNNNNFTIDPSAYAGSPAGEHPIQPQYHGMTNPDGTLKSQFEMSSPDINTNQQGINDFRQEATRAPGAQSAWASLQSQKQANATQGLQDSASQTSAGNLATQQSNLAAHGGMTSGAAERMGTQANTDLLNDQQNTARAGTQQQLDIGSTDDKNRVNELSQLPGMENQAVAAQQANRSSGQQADRFNTLTSMDDNHFGADQNYKQWNDQMSMYDNATQANALYAANKPGKKS